MLKQIRGTLKSVIAIIIILPLIVSFVAWGVPEMRQMTSNYALSVGSKGFSALEIGREFDRYVTNRRNQSEGAYTREQAIAEGAPNQIVESMATQAALDQEALKMGLIVTRPMDSKFQRQVRQRDARPHPARIRILDPRV